jgi:hypothetical protein
MVFEIRTLMTLILEDGEPDTELVRQRDAFFADRDRFEALFREVVREGIAQDVFRPVDVPIFVKLLLGAHNWVGVWYKPGGRLDGEQIAGLMTDMLLTGLNNN